MNDLLTDKDFIKVGHTGGLYGYEGALRLNMDSGYHNLLNQDVAFLYFKDNGMYVPRFACFWDVEQSLVGFDRIKSREEARNLTDQEVYLRKRDLPKSKPKIGDGHNLWEIIVGFQLWDVQSDVLLGYISDVEEYPAGWMMQVQKEDRGEFLLIPLAEQLIDQIDEENQVLYMDLPEGLDEL